jgi:hypothetical protein
LQNNVSAKLIFTEAHVPTAEKRIKGERKMDKKFSATVACVVLALMIVAPIMPQALATKPARMNTIQYRFFTSETALLTALLAPYQADGIDLMGWALTKAQYDWIAYNPGVAVAPLPQSGENELAFNSNWTNAGHPDGGARSAMNYTDFRQALACLVSKLDVIAGPRLQGFATRDDTQIPQPLMNGYVNPNVAYPNYPWEYQWDLHNALTILWNGGWYNHTLYGNDINQLFTTCANGSLATRAGTGYGVVYPLSDPNGQWGGSDPNAGARAADAGKPITKLKGYIRSGDARKDLGDMFCANLVRIGCPYKRTYCATLSDLKPNVMENNNPYDFATLGYSMGSPPNWWYSELTPVGIYDDGPNPYLVDDANMTYWAYKAFTDSTMADFLTSVYNVQDILVNEAYLVSAYSPSSYCAYRVGLLGAIDELGYGYNGHNQLLNWVMMNVKKTNTNATWSGPPANTPDSNIIYYGTYNPPDMANPVFADTLFDFQLMDNIWTYPIATDPYDTMVVGSDITNWTVGGDLPWMAYSWKSELITNPTNASAMQWTNVTYWFRHDITWHDGYPFSVEDLNYTIYTNALYGDSWTHSSFVYACNCDTPNNYGSAFDYRPFFQKWDDWTCSVQITTASWLNLYLCNYEVIPYHLYRWIVPSNIGAAEAGTSKDGLHGIWPGLNATSDNFLPGGAAYGITYANVTNKPDYTVIGTGPWKYRLGSTNARSLVRVRGGITLDEYPGFFLKIAPGALKLRYHWLQILPSQQPSGGYYRIGLPDLVMLANAYGKTGTPPSTVPATGNPGALGAWNPAADIAVRAGVVDLYDLTMWAMYWGWYWGNYSYNPTLPPSEYGSGYP